MQPYNSITITRNVPISLYFCLFIRKSGKISNIKQLTRGFKAYARTLCKKLKPPDLKMTATTNYKQKTRNPETGSLFTKATDMENDSMLCAPWTGIVDPLELETVLNKELSTFTLIHNKNLEEFDKKRSLVETTLNVEKISPVKPQHCCQIRERYLLHEKKLEGTIKEYKTKYNKLLEEESQLFQDISELDKTSQKLVEEEKMVQERLKSLKKQHKEEKLALKETYKLFSQTFGINVTVDENTDNSNTIKASVTFKGTDASIKFIIHRTSNTVLDFDAGSFIPTAVAEELKSKHEQTNNTLALVNALRNYVLENLAGNSNKK